MSKIKSRILHFYNPLISLNSTICKNAYIGDILNLKIGDNSSLGENFQMNNVELMMGSDIMIAKDVLIMGGGIILSKKIGR